MLVVPTGYMMNPRYIINFPTKRKWREKSRLEDIEAGLLALVEEVRTREIASIAVPPLGCGLGGLEPLHLRYVKHLYGPYAHNLNKVIEILDGHFIRGYGDSQTPDTEIELVPAAIDETDSFLAASEESRARLDRVAEVIAGFETPYGMELLSSVHWLASHEKPEVKNSDEAVRAIDHWNDRKRAMFKPEHIRVAWVRLHELGWLPATEKDHG